MPLIKTFKQHTPQVAEGVFVAENATLIGEVFLATGSSVWYGAVLRGDVGAIRVGENSNIQDHALLHCTTGRTPCVVGKGVVVGHRAILHGCTIEDECLIGMGAIVLDEALVPRHTVVAAGALVTEGKQLESGFLYAGVPARKVKALTPAQIEQIRRGASHYVAVSQVHRDTVPTEE
jgi:carbonic anhydrase/acetyltransferase-like protein (isoleucine patch superfamily)